MWTWTRGMRGMTRVGARMVGGREGGGTHRVPPPLRELPSQLTRSASPRKGHLAGHQKDHLVVVSPSRLVNSD